jgi:hypothetical protein
MGMAIALGIAAPPVPPVAAGESAAAPGSSAPQVAAEVEVVSPEEDDRRPAAGLLEITPAGGLLGEQPLFALRGAYTITPRLAIEAEIGHNVGDFVSAYLHSAGLRVQALGYRGHAAFLTAGFGTFGAAGGDAIAAQNVTRSDLRLGCGISVRVREDVGVRLDLRHHRVLLGGDGDGGEMSLGANEVSLGLSFSRRIWSPPSSSGRSAS